jgi:hypothetical protein
MSKIIFWVVVVFAVLFALRLYNAAKARRRDAERRNAPAPPAPAPTVRCASCGIYLPKVEASEAPGGWRCAECTRR